MSRLGASAVLAALLGLTSCAAVPISNPTVVPTGHPTSHPTRTRDGTEVSDTTRIDAFALKLGDCFNEPGSETVDELTVVPCSKPHDNEAYSLVRLPEGQYPGTAAIETKIQEGCAATFEEFVGAPYSESELKVGYFTPTAESWKNGDRELVCFVYQDGTQTTGSLARTAR